MDLLNNLNPVILAAITSGAFVPTLHDFLVKWNATPKFKSWASIVIAVIVAAATALAAPGDLTANEFVAAVLFGLGTSEVSYRKQHAMAKGTDKPTPLAVAPRFGIGGTYTYEGD